MRGIIRPTPVVMSRSALVPVTSRIEPPPNQFTHEVRKRQPYYQGARKTARSSGVFEKGTKVVLMLRDRGRMCRVADGNGLYVLTPVAGLVRLKPDATSEESG